MTYPALPYGKMVTVRNRFVSGTDDFGNDVYGYAESSIGPCSVQQASSRETIVNTDQVSTGIIVFMPYGTSVSYLDSMVIDGIEYEITGDPESWVSPFSGHTSPIRVHGILVKGASP